MSRYRKSASVLWNDKRFQIGLRAALTLALVMWCYDRFWSDDIIDSVRQADFRFILLSMITSLCAIGLWAVRWGAVLHELDYRIAISRLALFNLMSQGASLAVPGTVGADILRAHCLCKESVPLKDGVVAIAMDRFFGIAGLIVLGLAASLWFSSNLVPVWQLVAAMLVCFALIYLAFNLPRTLTRPLGKLLFALPFRRQLDEFWQSFQSMKSSISRPTFLSRQVLLAVLIQGMHATTALIIGLAFGIQIEWLTCLMVIPLVSVVSSLPISLHGLGVREAALVLLLTELGHPAQDGLIIGLAMTTELYVIAAVGAALVILKKNRARAHAPDASLYERT